MNAKATMMMAARNPAAAMVISLDGGRLAGAEVPLVEQPLFLGDRVYDEREGLGRMELLDQKSATSAGGSPRGGCPRCPGTGSRTREGCSAASGCRQVQIEKPLV